jgi:hypothetical protein
MLGEKEMPCWTLLLVNSALHQSLVEQSERPF